MAPALAERRLDLSHRARLGRAVSYRRILVPLARREGSEQAMAIACQLAAERHAVVTATTVLEVAAELPLDALLPEEEVQARRLLSAAAAIGDLHGVSVTTHVLRGRAAGETIVEDAKRAGTELIVIGAVRKQHARASAPVFGRTVYYVMRHAPCRVMLAAPAPS